MIAFRTDASRRPRNAILALALASLFGATEALAQPSEPVRDRNGRTIAYLKVEGSGRTTVTDCNGALLGHADRNGTFDRNGSRVSDNAIPGLLVGRSKCAADPTGSGLR